MAYCSSAPTFRRYAIAALVLVMASSAAASQGGDVALRHARALLGTTPLIDTHNDLPWVIREKGTPPRDVEAYDIGKRARFDTDIPRLREGMVGAQFWSVYVPSNFSPFDAMRAQLEQIDIARRLIAKYPLDLGFATSVADIRREKARRRIASLIGIEGGQTIANSLGALRAYYDLGVRYMTLTHFHTTDWADAATHSARHDGLTPFGREVVREMNRLGMMVDISRVSSATMSDVVSTSEAPVIFSHSSARALTDHVRNVPDSILRRMRANGGVVMVNFVTSFVSEPVRRWSAELLPQLQKATSDSQWQRITRAYVTEMGPSPRATVKDLADHVEHIRDVAGIDHVGIGADFYGAEAESDLVLGLEDVSKYPALFAALIRRGWSDADLRKLAAENLLRVFGQVEAVSARLRRERPPSNATIEALDGPCASGGAATAGCAANAGGATATDTRDVERALVAITDSVAAAVGRRDVPALGRLFGDAQYIINARVFPPGRYAELAGGGLGQVTDFTFSWHERDVRVLSPDAALLTGSASSVAHDTSGKRLAEDGLYTMTFIRRPAGDWRLMNVHKTAIEPPAPTASSALRLASRPDSSAREGYTTTSDGVRLWYRIVGNGPETVIAGAGMYHVRSLDALARGRRLVLFDSRGRGKSDTIPPSKMTVEGRLLDIEAIRQAVRADSFALIGWSGLAPDVFAYALRHPGRVTRLVQLAPLAPRRGPFVDEIRASMRSRTDTAAQARLAARVAAGEFRDRQAALCRETARLSDPPTFGDPAFARLAPDVCDSPNEWPERYGKTAQAAMASLAAIDWRDSLRAVTIPRLVIHGERDNFPLEGSREWAAGQPNARLLVIPGAGHWPHYERSEQTLGAIDEFLRGRWPAGSQSISR